MSDFLFQAHSGIRYLVLLAGSTAVFHSLLESIRRRPFGRPGPLLARFFLGALDLQILIGLALLLVHPYYPMLLAHVVLMVFAALLAHTGQILHRRRPPERQSHSTQLRWVLLTILLIAAGIRAIGRTIL